MCVCVCVIPPGWLVGERAPASALPPLVSLRLLPQASGRLAAPQGGDPGGAALRHRGTGRPGNQLLHPGLGSLPNARQRQVPSKLAFDSKCLNVVEIPDVSEKTLIQRQNNVEHQIQH